ncbi:MAG: glycosyltransferase [Oscillospiraceae bacterium]|nr:glycosyltransferase [Oscillospiraceae bacterium]
MQPSNGSRYYQAIPVRVGIVADSFLYENYAPSAALTALTPDNWEALLPELDCVLITSVWHGLAGEWTGAAESGTPARAALHALAQTAHAAGCPVLFYSKEDPPNYAHFVSFARDCDVVFTSAAECIARYQQACPGKAVHPLAFAVNPMLHNPIDCRCAKQSDCVLFAGSWIPKYPARMKSQHSLFHWVHQAGLLLRIADRNFSRNVFRYRFPLRYMHDNIGSFSYRELSVIYKLFPWVLNLNSVANSETMFAMRVYDALACGALVLSNESAGMERLFPAVQVIRTREDLRRAAAESVLARERRRLDGIRSAFRQGTVFERMAFLLETAGVRAQCLPQRRVGVVVQGSGDGAAQYREMFDRQTYADKCLIFLPGDEKKLPQCQMLALWGSGRRYGPCYLEDMINGFKYTSCDYITKHAARVAAGQQHCYTGSISDRYATVFWAASYSISDILSLPDTAFPLPNGYAADAECSIAPLAMDAAHAEKETGALSVPAI